MPNSVSFSNDQTVFKAFIALMGENDMSVKEAQQAIDRLVNAGILFREPAEKEGKDAKEVKPAE